MPKVEIVLELDLVPKAAGMPDEAFDAWAWSLERQVEMLDLVKTASVVDFTMKEDR